MLVMTKKKLKLNDSVDYQNAGPPMNFLCVFTRSLDQFCDVRVCYRLMDMAVEAMHTADMHNILLESLLSDV